MIFFSSPHSINDNNNKEAYFIICIMRSEHA